MEWGSGPGCGVPGGGLGWDIEPSPGSRREFWELSPAPISCALFSPGLSAPRGGDSDRKMGRANWRIRILLLQLFVS